MKIGDKIEILEVLLKGSYGWWNIGDIYTIYYVNGNSFGVRKPNGDTNGWSIEYVKFKILKQSNYYFY